MGGIEEARRRTQLERAARKEVRAVQLSKEESDGLLEIVKQMHRESRSIFANRILQIVERFDAGRAMVPFERDDDCTAVAVKAIQNAGAELATARRIVAAIAEDPPLDVEAGDFGEVPGDWQRPVEVLRPGAEWAAIEGLQIRDPDGWREGATLGEKPLGEPIGFEEYRERLVDSTVGPLS